MVTLGDLIEYDGRTGIPTCAEVVGKTRDRTTGRRVYEAYPLVPIGPGSDTFEHAAAWVSIGFDRVDRRVRNDGSYTDAWKRMGWLQTGSGESARFERLGPNVADPMYASTVSDSSDESTDDASDTDSYGFADTDDDTSWIVSDTSTSASASDSDADDSGAESDPSPSLACDGDVEDAHRTFSEWVPHSPGEARFKSTIADLEARASSRLANRSKKKS